MEFASTYVYDAPVPEYECISDDEFEKGMTLSESDSSDDSSDVADSIPEHSKRRFGNPSPKSQSRSRLEKGYHHWKVSQSVPQTDNISGKRRFRRADTNVISVKFNTLLSPGNMHAGDPVRCEGCPAFLSYISKLEGEDQQKWRCEFCAQANEVDVCPEEVPRECDVTYLLQPALTTTHSSMAGQDTSLVVFCFDTSGSMCVTSEIRKKKQEPQRQMQEAQAHCDNSSTISQSHEVVHVSRLECVQSAVGRQITEMMQESPHRRLALVTFSSEVCVVGDGTQEEVTMAGDKLLDEEILRRESKQLKLPGSVRDSGDNLKRKVERLEEGGATALGPALIISSCLASHQPGSKVIVCTDGRANIGPGKMEDGSDDDIASKFYDCLGDHALDAGVTISVITIKGTDCKLVHLGKLADKTGGQVNIVDPQSLGQEFSSVLSDPIIATKVKATLVLFEDLTLYDESLPDKETSKSEVFIGNVTANSEITFQFARRQMQQKHKINVNQQMNNQDSQGSEEHRKQERDIVNKGDLRGDLPFQLQIEYTDKEGNKALKVITRTMPRTREREVAEKHVNLDVLGVHAAKKSADLALKGEYSSSRSLALMNQRLAWRYTHSTANKKQVKGKYANIFGKLRRMENCVQQQQRTEISRRGRTHSDSEEDDSYSGRDYFDAVKEGKAELSQMEVADCMHSAGDAASDSIPVAKKFASARKKKPSSTVSSDRAREMEDSMANMMYQFRSVGQYQMASSEAPSGPSS